MPKVKTTVSVKKDTRVRNYACVVYPESAPDNWLSILAEAKTAIFVSPLHDKDINPEGDLKKPHYHVLVAYEGKKSLEQFEEFRASFGGVGNEIVQSLRGYARYLCHLDNPEKHQYKTEDVRAFGGADYPAAIGLPTDKYKSIREMMDFIRANNIKSYSDLLEYASECHYDWFRILCDSGTYVIKEFLKSRDWTYGEQVREQIKADRMKAAENLKESELILEEIKKQRSELREALSKAYCSSNDDFDF